LIGASTRLEIVATGEPLRGDDMNVPHPCSHRLSDCAGRIPDHAGLKSTMALLSRTHHSAAAVFRNGPQHTDNPTPDDYPPPQ